jgi:hypothetical protein
VPQLDSTRRVQRHARRDKHAAENYLTALVKAGKKQLREAQEGIAKDWT